MGDKNTMDYNSKQGHVPLNDMPDTQNTNTKQVGFMYNRFDVTMDM